MPHLTRCLVLGRFYEMAPLVSIARSKPSAFQAVSIKRVWMTIGG